MRSIELDFCDGINKNTSDIRSVKPVDSRVQEQKPGDATAVSRDISREVTEVRSTLGLDFQDWGKE